MEELCGVAEPVVTGSFARDEENPAEAAALRIKWRRTSTALRRDPNTGSETCLGPRGAFSAQLHDRPLGMEPASFRIKEAGSHTEPSKPRNYQAIEQTGDEKHMGVSRNQGPIVRTPKQQDPQLIKTPKTENHALASAT